MQITENARNKQKITPWKININIRKKLNAIYKNIYIYIYIYIYISFHYQDIEEKNYQFKFILIWCHIVGKTAGMNIEVAEKMEEMKDKIMALEKQNHQLKEKVKTLQSYYVYDYI